MVTLTTPPILTGTDAAQIQALRRYLIRLVEELKLAISSVSGTSSTDSSASTNITAEEKAEMQQNIADNERDIRSLETELGTTNKSVEGLGTRVGTLEGNYSTLSGKVETLEGEYTTVSGAVTDLQSEFSTGAAFGGGTIDASKVKMASGWTMQIGDTSLSEAQLIKLLALIQTGG